MKPPGAPPPKRKYKQYQFRDVAGNVAIPRSTIHQRASGRARKWSKDKKQVIREQALQHPVCKVRSQCSQSSSGGNEVNHDLTPNLSQPQLSTLETERLVSSTDQGQVIWQHDHEEVEENEDEDNAPEDYYNEEDVYGDEHVELGEEMCDQRDDKAAAAVIDMPSASDSESDEEEVSDAPYLNLSTQEKINILLLLTTKKRHNLTYSATVNVMQFAGLFTSDSSSTFLPSKHILKSAIKFFSSSVTEHHICPACQAYIGIVEKVFICPKCGNQGDAYSNKTSGNIFLYISLHDQLKCLFESCVHDFVTPSEREKINRYNYEDIYDGKVYKDRVDSESVSFNFFVDGVQVATTSKKAAWPVLLSVNELPVHLRRKYILMSSLWLGLKKPVMNEYLKPFVNECADLATNGFSFKKNGILLTKKIKALMCVSDSVARPLLRNSKQFNGRFGCGLCYHPGIRLRFGNGRIRSYSIADQVYPLRTHAELMNHARLAEARRASQNGIKGISILSHIPDFDMVMCLDLDLFHALVNAAKRFCNLWFSKKYVGQPYNVARSLASVDARLLSITPTMDVSRAPRSLTERSDYRGHEWYFWVIVYSIPCLKNILPQRFLNHWSLLVHALAIVMQNSVTKSEVCYADRYLLQFVSEIDNLYGREHVTFSIHLLTHLRTSIENFGQPWTHSAFLFESFNSEIKNAVKSSNGAAIQICDSINLKEALKRLEDLVFEDMNEEQKAYLEKITVTKKFSTPHSIVGPAQMLGKPRKAHNDYLRALKSIRVSCGLDDISVFERCYVFKEIFHGTLYKKASKQCNSLAFLESGQFFEIEGFLVVFDKCYCIGHFFSESADKKQLCSENLPHIVVLNNKSEGVLRAISVSDIQCKLLSFRVDLSNGVVLKLAVVNVLKSEMLT